MTVGGGGRSVGVNGSCCCGGASMIVTLHLYAWMLPIGVRQHGVLRAEHFSTNYAPELVVYSRMHVGYVFSQVTAVPDYFTTIWAILAWIVWGQAGPCKSENIPLRILLMPVCKKQQPYHGKLLAEWNTQWLHPFNWQKLQGCHITLIQYKGIYCVYN